MNAFGDAPLEDGVEPVTWDADRLRAADTRVLEQGTRWYSVAAVAAGGDFAALTQVTVDPGSPEWAFQEMTAVTRPHRGHRLGLLVKVAMLEMLAEVEPQLRRIVTSNAEVNVHMVAVNEALGYVGHRLCRQLRARRDRRCGPAGVSRNGPVSRNGVSRRSPGGVAGGGRAASPWRP